jgi:predicted transcriptional regulator
MTAKTTCGNPLCACEPCTCATCSCVVATLGDLERRVIGTLWEEPNRELSVRDVADALPEYAYTTVATVLDRLVHKGLVRRRLDGRTIRFATIGTGGTHTAVLMHEALAASCDGDAALKRFAETLSPSEASVLHRALNGVKRAGRGTAR